MADYLVGATEAQDISSRAVNAQQPRHERAAAGTVHAVLGDAGTWAPAACGAQVYVFPDPWSRGLYHRCETCLAQVPLD